MNVYDIAAKLKVSHTTVSLALRNHPRISLKMRLLVQETAREMGYAPNPLVRALMTQVRQGKNNPTGEVLGFLTAYEDENRWRKLPNTVNLYRGAERQATRLGFKIEPFWLGYCGTSTAHVAKVLRARMVRGSIVTALPLNHVPLQLDWHHHPVSTLGYAFTEQRVNQAAHNHFDGVVTCYSRLQSLGYRRIGMALTAKDDAQVHHYWTAGYFSAVRHQGGEVMEECLMRSFDDEKGFLRWFRKNRPDAIIGTYPNTVLAMIKNMGFSVPEEIGYVGLDVEEQWIGKISGIRQDWEQMGMALVDLLAGQLYANDYGLPVSPKTMLIEGHWEDGTTTSARTVNPAKTRG